MFTLCGNGGLPIKHNTPQLLVEKSTQKATATKITWTDFYVLQYKLPTLTVPLLALDKLEGGIDYVERCGYKRLSWYCEPTCDWKC